MADGGVDDEVRGKRDGWIGDASFCDDDGQVVADRPEARGEGVGFRLAEVGFGVVLSDEQSPGDGAWVADSDGAGSGASHPWLMTV